MCAEILVIYRYLTINSKTDGGKRSVHTFLMSAVLLAVECVIEQACVPSRLSHQSLLG